MSNSRPLAASSCVVVLVALAGCGGAKTGDVAGKITVKGKPPNIVGLTVSFFAPDGQAASGPVALDGSYNVPGVPVGSVQIGISVQAGVEGTPAKPPKPTDGRAADPKAVAAYSKALEKAASNKAVPAKLGDPTSSGLQMTVEAGKPNTFDYDIK